MVSAVVPELIEMKNLPATVMMQTQRNGDSSVAIPFSVNRNGPVAEGRPFYLHVTSSAGGQGDFFFLNGKNKSTEPVKATGWLEKISNNENFRNQIRNNQPIEVNSYQAINSTNINYTINLYASAENYEKVRPGLYSTTLTIMVRAK